MKKILTALAVLAFALTGFILSAASANGVSDNCKDVAVGEGWGLKIDTVGDPATVTVNADEGFLIDKYCVKAGTTLFIVEVSPASASVVIDHPEKDSVSHYAVHQVPVVTDPTPDPEPTPPVVTEPPGDTPTGDPTVNPDPRPWPNQPKPNKPNKDEPVIPTVVNAGL